MLIKNILLILTTPLIVHSIELFGRYFYRCMNDNCSKLKLELNVKGMETLKVVLKSHHYRNFNETNCCFLSERKDRKYFVFFERCRENSRGLISDGHSEVMRIDPINHDTVSLRLFKLIDFYHELIRDEFKFKKINRDPIDTVNTTFGPVFNDPKRYPINLPIQGGYIETIVLYDSHFMEGKKQSTVMKTIQSSIKILIKWWARLGWFIVLKKIYFLNETFFDSNQHEGVPVIPKSALKESDYDLYIYFTKKYPSKSLHKTFGRICIESDQFIYSVILASFHENHLAIALDLFNRLAILMGIEYNTCIGNFDCRWQACTNSTDQFDLRSFYLLTKSAYYLSIIKQTNHPTCLLNKPDHQMAMCGNGIIENDEECDCILSDCEHCCIKCQLAKSGKQACGSGPCCNFKTCQLYHYHNYHVCRERLDVCDIPDVCDGRSSQCPPDAYVRDGTVCDNRNRSGYCFNGLCGTAEVQCNLLFNTSNGPVNCYTKNFQGTIPNNCGPTFGEVNQSNYLQCKGFDYLCGKLNCKLSKPDQLQNKLDWLFNSKVSVLKSGLNNPTYIEVPVYSIGFDYRECLTVFVKSSLRELPTDPTYVPDGSPCGPSKMCVNQTCFSVVKFLAQRKKCPYDCNNLGFCDNQGVCHCYTFSRRNDCRDLLPSILSYLISFIAFFVLGSFASTGVIFYSLRGKAESALLPAKGNKEKSDKFEESQLHSTGCLDHHHFPLH